jgi:hypothetical protein
MIAFSQKPALVLELAFHNSFSEKARVQPALPLLLKNAG